MCTLHQELAWTSEAVKLLILIVQRSHTQQPAIRALLQQGQGLMRISPLLRPHMLNDEPQDEVGGQLHDHLSVLHIDLLLMLHQIACEGLYS